MERECVYGAARDVTSNDAAGRAGRLCEQVNTSLQGYCFEGIGTILGGLHPRAERRAACRRSRRTATAGLPKGAAVR